MIELFILLGIFFAYVFIGIALITVGLLIWCVIDKIVFKDKYGYWSALMKK